MISNHIDEKKFEGKIEEIKKILNPYKDYKKDNLRKTYSVFLGFEWKSLAHIDFKMIQNELKEKLEKVIEDKSKNIEKKCNEQINSSNININVEISILPFKDLDKIREYFLEALG